jgi:hypothetical protein
MIGILEKLKDDSFYYGEYGQQWLSNSDIYTLLNDPLQFRVPKEQTKAMLEGRYFHTAILEPEKIQNFIIADVASRNTKKYKELVEEHGQMLLLQKEKDDIDKAILTIKSNMDMAEEIYHPSNEYEDIICEDKIIDLKTTSDITKFRSSAYRYNYDSQAYIYQKLFNKPVHFYVVDKSTLQLGVYIPSEDFLKNGRDKVENAIFIYNTFFSENSTEDINQHIIYETL